MKIVLLGPKGCRESAILYHLKQKNHNVIHFSNESFLSPNQHDLIFPTNETLLVDGIVNRMNEKNIPCFGPTRQQAMLEGSKIFAKKVLNKLQIPTAEWEIGNPSQHLNDWRECQYKIIKIDGLAGGKGVFMPPHKVMSTQEGFNRFKTIMDEIKQQNQNYLVEKKLYGEEISMLAFCNGKQAYLMPSARDYKRSRDNNEGTNTGGMGAYAPISGITPGEMQHIQEWMNKVVKEFTYKGILYMGLMKTKNGLFVLEFNCRFGDPEAQVLLELLESDLAQIMIDCINGDEPNIKWKNAYSVTVVLTNYQYPERKIPCKIKNLNQLNNQVRVYMGSSQGGRVASITSTSNTLMKARINVYNNIRHLELEGDKRYYRMDLAIKELLNKPKTKKLNIAILGSTNGTSSKALMQAYKENIQLVVSNKSKSGILQKAKEYKIRNIYLPCTKINKETYDEELCNLFKFYDIDYIFLIGYMRFISKTMLDRYPNKILNIHPSLLPRHEGLMNLDVHQQVIYSGDKISGCTLHRVTEEVDGGDIVLQKQCLVNPDETKETLKQKVQKLEEETILECMDLLLNGSLDNKITYEDSGVSIQRGDGVVEFLQTTNKDIGGFCTLKELPRTNRRFLAMTCDGIGTKIELMIKHNKLYDAAYDLVAMNVNDMICHGASPKYFMDYVATERIHPDKMKEFLRGLQDACRESMCNLVGGETAEMNRVYKTNGMDIAGFAIGYVCESDILPRNVKKGDKLYALTSNGVHANGFSLIHKFVDQFDMDELLKPTKIYVKDLSQIQQQVKAIAHITGGGIVNNLPRVLNGQKFVLKNWEWPKIFQKLQKLTNLSDMEMMSTFNCGIGMVVVVSPNMELPNKFFEIGEII
jgi:phosphoribosylformylglycinamidine cyclo-ligase